MTDNEIIKALEYWKKFDNEIDQMLSGRFKDDKMLIEQKEIVKITLNIFDLINRLQAENERLKTNLNVELDNFASEYDDKIKSEAVKEFVEKLKEYGVGKLLVIRFDCLDHLVKEMVGEKNG